MYKYTKQLVFSTRWKLPPWQEGFQLSNIDSWKKLKTFFTKIKIFNPEVLMPPELLFPWIGERPCDVEILNSDVDSECKLDINIIKKILNDVIKPSTYVTTWLDFASTQTTTNKCLDVKNYNDFYKKSTNDKSKLSQFKYVSITKWIDQGMNLDEKDCSLHVPVWKRPSEYRSAITLAPWTLYKVWELNQALKHTINHKSVGDYTTHSDLLKFTKGKNSRYLMTDWKKSGLTMPHWFVKIVIDRLIEVGQKISFNPDGWVIYDKVLGQVFEPKNFGYGLGMINNMYTLFNIVLFEYGKQINLFSPEDEMISFNDDSVIRYKAEHSVFNRWLQLCSKSGGWLDEYKTFESDGPMFCEMYQFNNIECNFKWVSAFHTLFSTFSKSYNFDNWRFLASDTYRAIRGFDADITANGMKYANCCSETAITYLIMIAERTYNIKIDNTIPPELGGVSVGSYHLTRFGLKTSLLILEEKFITAADDYYKCWKYLYVLKETINHTSKFSPWNPFPEGRTKKIFQYIGKYQGLNNELKSLYDKTENKFVTERNFVNKDFWVTYSKGLIDNHDLIIDYWSWSLNESWKSYAIPNYFVSESSNASGVNLLPFVNIKRSKPICSWPSMTLAYIEWMSKGYSSTDIKKEEIDFSSFCDYDVPIISDSDTFRPIIDMNTISKLSDFSSPMSVQKDFVARNEKYIINLKTKNKRAKAALSLMKLINPEGLGNYNGATWYTKTPVPYQNKWLEYIANQLPIFHEQIFECLDRGYDLNEFEKSSLIFSINELQNHKIANKKFWKEKTNSKKTSFKKLAGEYAVELSDKLERERADLELKAFLEINCHESYRVINELIYSRIVEEPKPIQKFEFKPIEIDLNEYNFEPEVYDPDSEICLSDEEDENDLIAYVLDIEDNSIFENLDYG